MIDEYSIHDVRACGCDIPVTARSRKTIYKRVGPTRIFRPIREARGSDMLHIRAQEHFMSNGVEKPFVMFRQWGVFTEADIDAAWERYKQTK